MTNGIFDFYEYGCISSGEDKVIKSIFKKLYINTLILVIHIYFILISNVLYIDIDKLVIVYN